MAFLAPNMSAQSVFCVHVLVVVLSRVVVQFMSPGAHSGYAGVMQNVPNIIGIINNNFFINLSMGCLGIFYHILAWFQNSNFKIIDFWDFLFYYIKYDF